MNLKESVARKLVMGFAFSTLAALSPAYGAPITLTLNANVLPDSGIDPWYTQDLQVEVRFDPSTAAPGLAAGYQSQWTSNLKFTADGKTQELTGGYARFFTPADLGSEIPTDDGELRIYWNGFLESGDGGYTPSIFDQVRFEFNAPSDKLFDAATGKPSLSNDFSESLSHVSGTYQLANFYPENPGQPEEVGSFSYSTGADSWPEEWGANPNPNKHDVSVSTTVGENPSTTYIYYLGWDEFDIREDGQDWGLKGGRAATTTMAEFATSLSLMGEDFKMDGLTGADNVHLTADQFEQDLSVFLAGADDNDNLLLYIVGHGGVTSYYTLTRNETTANYGDERIKIGDSHYLTDDRLTTILQPYANLSKSVFIDACLSGGFWGNGGELQGADLDTVPNTALFTSASETGVMQYWVGSGQPIFSETVRYALTYDESLGSVRADAYNGTIGDLTWLELVHYVTDWATSSDLWDSGRFGSLLANANSDDAFRLMGGYDLYLTEKDGTLGFWDSPAMRLLAVEDRVFTSSSNMGYQGIFKTAIASPVPEPSTLLLMFSTLFVLAFQARRPASWRL